MNCVGYQKWISRSAQDPLNAAREAELHRHLTACPSCRRWFRRERDLLAAVDQTLARAPAEEPSADLYVRVRQKISESADSGVGFGPVLPRCRWALAAAACIVVVAAGLAWLWRRPSSRTSAQLIETADRVQPAPRTVHSEAQPAVLAGNQDRGEAVRHSERSTTSRRLRRSASRQTPAPRVIVPRDEMALVLKLCNDVRTGKLDGASLLAAPPGFKLEADGSLVTIPIKIKPVEIAAINLGPALK